MTGVLIGYVFTGQHYGSSSNAFLATGVRAAGAAARAPRGPRRRVLRARDAGSARRPARGILVPSLVADRPAGRRGTGRACRGHASTRAIAASSDDVRDDGRPTLDGARRWSRPSDPGRPGNDRGGAPRSPRTPRRTAERGGGVGSRCRRRRRHRNVLFRFRGRPAPPDPAAPHDITGDEAVYPLLILFGLNIVDELDRTAFGILAPEIRDDFGLDQPGILTLVAVVALLRPSLLQVPHRPLRRPAATGSASPLVGAAVWGALLVRHRPRRRRAGCSSSMRIRLRHRPGGGRPDPQLAARRLLPARPAGRGCTRSTAPPTPSAQFLGPLIGGAAGVRSFGWRAPFFVFAIPTVVLVVIAGLR